MATLAATDSKQASVFERERQARQAALFGVVISLALVVVTGSFLGAATQQGTGQPDGTALTSQLINLVWLFLATAFVFLIVIGMALRGTGAARRKNALKIMMGHVATAFVAILGFFFIGFALQSGGLSAAHGAATLGGIAQLNGEVTLPIGNGHWGLFGTRGFTLTGGAYDAAVGFLFLFQASIMVVAIIPPVSAMAERFRLGAAIIWALFASALLYPIFANWAWGGGWLAQLRTVGLGAGYVDFGGSGVIHAVGGLAALAGASVVRARIRKFNMDETANVIPPHNLVFFLTGSLLCVLGWFGLITGTLLTQDAALMPRIGLGMTVIVLSGAGGAITAMLYSWIVARPFTTSIPTKGFPDASMAANGLLGGLVAGSAACLCVTPLSGLIIGAVAGILVPISLTIIEERFKIDDVAGVVSVHGICGLWGLLAVGIFADGTLTIGSHTVRGLISGDVSQFGAQLIGALAALVWGFGGAYVFFSVLNRLVRLRVPSGLEMHIQGLDVLELGAPAYTAQHDPVHGQWPRIAEGSRAYRPDADTD
jgi:Amt family ammonium transporter